MIAKISGITVGTNARNRNSSTIRPAIRPKISLEPDEGAPCEASPVNWRLSPAFVCDRLGRSPSAPWSWSMTGRSCSSRSSGRRSRRVRVFERLPLSNGLVVRVAYCAFLAIPMISSIAALCAGVSMRWPGGAWNTKVSALPFCAGNFAFSRSVARCVSEPGSLNSLTSLPWNADRETDQHERSRGTRCPITRHGWLAHARSKRASAPVGSGRASLVELMLGHVCLRQGVDASGRVVAAIMDERLPERSRHTLANPCPRVRDGRPRMSSR